MYAQFLERFKLIEDRRNTNLTTQVNSLVKQRTIEKQNLINNIQEFNNRIIKDNNLKIEEAKQAHARKIEENKKLQEQEIINIEAQKIELDNAYLKPDDSFTSILENEKIEIIPFHTNNLTNIPLSDDIVNKYIVNYQKPLSGQMNSTLLESKRFINKRISQVSTNTQHIQGISRDLLNFTTNPELAHYIATKIIQQAKLQVAVHLESYKGYAYFFMLLNNEQIMQDFRYKVFTDDSIDNNASKGIYMVYFGILKLLKSFEEAWFLFTCMLNVKPIEKSLYVLESFLLVLGSDLRQYYGAEFGKIQKFICESYWTEIDNRAVKTRIKTLLTKLSPF